MKRILFWRNLGGFKKKKSDDPRKMRPSTSSHPLPLPHPPYPPPPPPLLTIIPFHFLLILLSLRQQVIPNPLNDPPPRIPTPFWARIEKNTKLFTVPRVGE